MPTVGLELDASNLSRFGIDGDIDLGSGSLNVRSGSIDIAGAITTQQAQIELTARSVH